MENRKITTANNVYEIIALRDATLHILNVGGHCLDYEENSRNIKTEMG